MSKQPLYLSTSPTLGATLKRSCVQKHIFRICARRSHKNTAVGGHPGWVTAYTLKQQKGLVQVEDAVSIFYHVLCVPFCATIKVGGEEHGCREALFEQLLDDARRQGMQDRSGGHTGCGSELLRNTIKAENYVTGVRTAIDDDVSVVLQLGPIRNARGHGVGVLVGSQAHHEDTVLAGCTSQLNRNRVAAGDGDVNQNVTFLEGRVVEQHLTVARHLLHLRAEGGGASGERFDTGSVEGVDEHQATGTVDDALNRQ